MADASTKTLLKLTDSKYTLEMTMPLLHCIGWDCGSQRVRDRGASSIISVTSRGCKITSLYGTGHHLRTKNSLLTFHILDVPARSGGGPKVVVSTAAFHARVRGSVPDLGGLKETKMFLPHPRVKLSIVGSLRDREVACSASDRHGSNFESCVWRTVSSHPSHHPQEVFLARLSLYVHKGGLKPDSFHFFQLGQCP